MNFSQASARYEQGEVNASVEIFDYAHIGTLYAPFKMLVKMKLNKESTSGYERSTEIAGFPPMKPGTTRISALNSPSSSAIASS